MSAMLHDRPSHRLTSHFFRGLFDFGFLSEAGSDSFVRMILGILSVIIAFGLLLARIFMTKYAGLSAVAYRQAVLADETFVIALPMLVVAFVTVLVSHSLFPDETDFYVLMALPITKRLVFVAKLLALVLFTGLFIGGAHVAMAPLFLLISISRWAEHSLVPHGTAYLAASLLASGFVVLAVTAINGLVVTFTPRSSLATAAGVVRTAMLSLLVLSLPLIGRLPAQASSMAGADPRLYFAPPVWFLGVERVLLGDPRPYFAQLGQIATAAVAAALLIAFGTYAILYRRFDRVMLRPGDVLSRRAPRPTWSPPLRREPSQPVFFAIRRFTLTTLARSALHHGILVGVAAAGVGLVLNRLIGVDLSGWLRNGGAPSPRLVQAATWGPFALVFIVSLAVKAALIVPLELRANWAFRMTEEGAFRSDQMRAVVHIVRGLGIVLPVAVMFPLQWIVLGRAAFLSLTVTILCGLLFVELLVADWRRIPFTCSYIPGKRFVPQTLLLGVTAFTVFTTVGSGLARFSMTHPVRSLVIDAILCVGTLLLCWRRRRRWRQAPLEFEDELPSELHPLRLSID